MNTHRAPHGNDSTIRFQLGASRYSSNQQLTLFVELCTLILGLGCFVDLKKCDRRGFPSVNYLALIIVCFADLV